MFERVVIGSDLTRRRCLVTIFLCYRTHRPLFACDSVEGGGFHFVKLFSFVLILTYCNTAFLSSFLILPLHLHVPDSGSLAWHFKVEHVSRTFSFAEVQALIDDLDIAVPFSESGA